MSWFDEARFGLFVHWSFSSVDGLEVSWPMFGAEEVLPHAHKVPVADYYASIERFVPEPDAPERWAALAREAGARYVVLTTKHHDGFALFASEHSDFTAADVCGIDLVEVYARAAREAGLRVGFYYSLSDWHHPDYPPAADEHYIAYLGRRPSPEAWERYRTVLFGQVRELCTNYGPVDVLWFDGQWERTAEEWKATELRELIRELQPDALVNDRLPGQGDFATPEQSIPATAPEGRWETCLTMNHTWGHHPHDGAYKDVPELVRTLAETAARGGNLLLNVSPDGRGAIPEEQVRRLRAVGEWLSGHGDAVHGTEPGLEPWQFYGPSTRAGDRYFLFCLLAPFGPLSVRGLPIKRVASVRHLPTGRDLGFERRCTADQQLTNPDPVGEIVIDVPDGLVRAPGTVLELEISGGLGGPS